ncbi:hypothetical protein QEG73_03560 [Chitinophagaceae bacterium 26-R-25]|nr:hypothetical protein [Chitinophagaceae bacterium 26-R-25]
MQLNSYETTTTPTSLTRFQFYSIGPKGKVKKQIEFDQFPSAPEVYNLAFGDVNECGTIDDLAVTGNHDRNKVLMTVALTVNRFLQRHPESHIFLSGSTPARSRLYQIAISNNLEEIQHNFVIYGYTNDQWELFEPNKNYQAFLIRLKK